MATIKAIEGRTIHQIQSGQVIVDLCSVVKELVENSLDAGATSIEVRFKNHGLDSIEVQDNGDGITPENYETVALKHHTSKLFSYSDLVTLETFGFRGEALSSLCALSRFTIITCLAKDAPKGTKLEFEVSGELRGTSLVAAQKGTCVSVENLFNNLPVRRRETERKIKTEWNRVVTLLGQYACIQTGVKISVTHQPTKGKKTTVFSTKGNPSTRENIVNIFGAKTLTALLTLDLKLELEPTVGPSHRWTAQDDGGKQGIRIVGHISRPAFGEGRQTPDKQMFFVNARPCSLPQVSKAMNEVYKSYNSSQSPFILANIEMDTHLYDVNVSPDKRTILLHDQTRMLEQLKTSLTTLFESQDYTVPISQLPAQKQPLYKQLTITGQNTTASAPSHTSTDSTDDDNESQSKSPSAEREIEEDTPIKSRNPLFLQGAVSREHLNGNRESISLISNWVDKSTEERNGQKEVNPGKAAENGQGLSTQKLKLVERLVMEREEAETAGSDVPTSPEISTSSDGSNLPSHNPPMPVLDFNDRIAELRGEKENPTTRYEKTRGYLAEESIPALVPQPKRTEAGVIGVGNSSPRPFRSPAMTAKITIGDHSITSSVGMPFPKRVRTDKLDNRLTNDDPDLPSFGSRLSQRFAAIGTSQPSQSSSVDASSQGSELVLEAETSSNASIANVEDINGADARSLRESFTPDLAPDDSLIPDQVEGEDYDYSDEDKRKAMEDAKVQEMIKVAEEEALRPPEDTVKRTNLLLKGGARKKDSIIQLVRPLDTTIERINVQLHTLTSAMKKFDAVKTIARNEGENIDGETAEEKLSLKIEKSDFAKMKVIGQFNLGFILALRTSKADPTVPDAKQSGDDLFIIDQHASDEKYNFERLQATTVVQSQRMVIPRTLELTAVEEEIVIENQAALQTNGFIVNIDQSGKTPIGLRVQLVSLPLSRETTFSPADLEELISLLSEHPIGSGVPPRPSRVRKMFAMRACRSSIMIGKPLTHKQMGKVVQHMGEIDKPWNCPHGRPTMRHLCGMGVWDDIGWREGDGFEDEGQGPTNWAAYVKGKKALG